MSLTLKIGSLVIRTLAKPIGNYIKRNAREHEKFRKICVNFAQRLHRVDMRMRLGLLQAPEDIDRQTAEVAAKKKKTSEVATAKTQAQSVLDDGEAGPSASKEKMKSSEKAKSKKLVHIRPLSEAKAIDSGANFISETFLFFVAGGLIVLERWYSNRRETSRREDIAERLASLELEEVELKSKITSLEADLTHLNDEKSSHHTLEASKAQGREEEARSLANV